MTFLLWNGVTLIAICAALAGVLLVRKFANPVQLRANHEVTDPLMGVIGMLFAILLGFMVASAMNRFEEARKTAQNEAGAAGDVFRLARALPTSIKISLMQDTVKYIDLVVAEEWPLMEKEKMSEQAWSIYTDMWRHVTAYEPVTQGQSNIHQIMVGAMTSMGECRRARAAQMQTRLPEILWYVVYSGAIVTVAFSFFFSLRNLRLQLAMTALLTYVLCMNLFLLISFDEPYSGDVRVLPTAFEVDQKRFHHILDVTLSQNP